MSLFLVLCNANFAHPAHGIRVRNERLKLTKWVTWIITVVYESVIAISHRKYASWTENLWLNFLLQLPNNFSLGFCLFIVTFLKVSRLMSDKFICPRQTKCKMIFFIFRICWMQELQLIVGKCAKINPSHLQDASLSCTYSAFYSWG